MATANLTAQRARDLLAYDDASGALVSRTSRSKAKAGCEAGHVNPNGYRYLKVDGRSYSAHRLVWLLVHGSFPDADIDHIDGDRLNNRISNLRLCVGVIVNSHNQNRAQRGSRSGVLGVSWYSRDSTWHAAIRVNGKLHGLGYFKTIAEAEAVYRAARSAMHPASVDFSGSEFSFRNPTDAQRNSKSGVRGASWNKREGAWVAQANVNGKRVRIGLFATKEEAGQAYQNAIARMA